MKKNKRTILFVSLWSVLGVLSIFLTVSLITGEWKFFIFSIAPALVAGMTGLFVIRADKEKKM